MPATLLKQLCMKDCGVCQKIMEKIATVASTQLRDARFQLTHLLQADEDVPTQGKAGSSA
jgi:hypothetical protein